MKSWRSSRQRPTREALSSRATGQTTFWLMQAVIILLMAGCERGPERPEHLILVVYDTLRADRMSLYGYTLETTPFHQRLAEESLLFARARAPAPWTIPSHASLFTGLLPAQHQAQWGHLLLQERYETLAEVLRQQGFCTVGLSANKLVSDASGLTQGFEVYQNVGGSPRSRSERILSLLPEVLDGARSRGCRLFLFLNLMDAHIPYNSWRYARQFGAQGPGPVRNPKIKWAINSGQQTFSEQDRRLHGASYDAAVRQIDDLTEELVDILRSRGWLEETLLVLTSDHGEGLGSHAEIDHTISVWEEQLAIPLMLRFPCGWRAGERVDRVVGLDSLMPALLDWLRIARPEALRQTPSLEVASSPPPVADYRSYFGEGNRGMNQAIRKLYPQLAERVVHRHAIYCGDYKLIVTARQERSLYDLASDPAESHDLGSQPSPALQRCWQSYQTALAQARLTPFDFELSAESVADAEAQVDLKALRALGYVQ